MTVLQFLIKKKVVISRSEGRRLIGSEYIKINDAIVSPMREIYVGDEVKLGKTGYSLFVSQEDVCSTQN